ncbi:hypothetical protein EJF36_18835 [Bacillus sp. HMF5848]|uniref:hypothetical protein n=1 Tax=Bacillus sp. HMF5848 TaxID=2495421 RepID=UPI000F77A3D5|nr:hypothetical protein [Bacillus sp. HMF5848]RSK28763.1 hypothetical protein EJF36_18835 [Bacillus sp. HMF5848]
MAIKDVERVTYSLFSKEPISSNTIAYVYKNANDEYRVVKDGEQLTRSELKAKKYMIRYTVSMNSVSVNHQREYSSSDPGRYFNINVKVGVKVKDPIAIVENDVKDSGKFLQDNLVYWIQPITDDYSIEDFADVKAQFQKLKQQSDIVEQIERMGYEVTELHASARLSKADWEHYQKIVELKRKQELTELEMEIERKQKKKQTEWQLEDDDVRKKREKEEEEERRRKQKDEEEERKRKMRDAIRSGGIIDALIEGSASNDEVLSYLQTQQNDIKQMQKMVFEKVINSEDTDVEDMVKLMKKMGEITQVNSQPQLAYGEDKERDSADKKLEGNWGQTKQLLEKSDDNDEEDWD